MKYLKQFDKYSEYREALENGEIMTPSISVVENKVIYKSYPITKAGDVCVWDKNDLIYRFVSSTSYSESYWQDRTLIPIGIVAVPNTHTPDGTSRIMSLVNMSLKTPDVGTNTAGAVEGDNYMYWGATGDIAELPNLTQVTKVNPLTGEDTGTTDWVRIPSDRKFTSTGYVDPITDGYYYYNNYINDPKLAEGTTGEDRFGPSPFDAEGNKNPLYYKYATNDFDGRGNTDIIMSKVTATWKTGQIQNVTTAGNYPAAECCSRFYTTSTNQGDWYLPAIGEAMFLVARHVAINNGIKAVAKGGWPCVIIGNNTNLGTYGYWCWSSTEYGVSTARYTGTDGGSVYYNSKLYLASGNRVRAFFAL